MQFKDNAGNLSEPIFDDIILDLSRPQISDISTAKISGTKTFEFAATIIDPFSGINQAILCWRQRKAMEFGIGKNYEEITMEKTGNSFKAAVDFSQYNRKRIYYYYVAAQDNAGNWKVTPLYSMYAE